MATLPKGGPKKPRPAKPSSAAMACACVPMPPASGTWMLVAIDGVMDWQNLESPAAKAPKANRKRPR